MFRNFAYSSCCKFNLPWDINLGLHSTLHFFDTNLFASAALRSSTYVSGIFCKKVQAYIGGAD